MGKIYSMLTRPIRTFNIANRAERIISREKPIAAPQYASTEKQKILSNKVNPSFLEDHYQKDVQLDQRLKEVFVTSKDPQETIESVKESKPLPQERHISEDFTLDSYEPTFIPVGKCSLKQVFTFLSQHKDDPLTYSSENIAAEYKVDKKVIDNILKYFKLYVTVSPEQPEIIKDAFQEALDQAYVEKQKQKLLKDKK